MTWHSTFQGNPRKRTSELSIPIEPMGKIQHIQKSCFVIDKKRIERHPITILDWNASAAFTFGSKN